jgi:hypothetical protein
MLPNEGVGSAIPRPSAPRDYRISRVSRERPNDPGDRRARFPENVGSLSHVRVEAKRKELDALAGGVKATGYDTDNDTTPDMTPVPSPEVLEKNGGDDGTRTRGLP